MNRDAQHGTHDLGNGPRTTVASVSPGHISTNCKNKDEWDSDANLDSDSSDDDVKPSKKGLVSIAIKEAPSLFDTPYCLMTKGEPKVCEVHEFTYDDLVEMVSNLDDLLGDMKGKYKSLRKKHVSLQESNEELKTTHENLLDTHEKLKEAHNSHISQEANKVKVDVGITCDLLDDICLKLMKFQNLAYLPHVMIHLLCHALQMLIHA
jgi:hypothetical protein